MRNNPGSCLPRSIQRAFYLAVINTAMCGFAQSTAPSISSFSPRTGAEGTRVEISGVNLQGVSEVLFGISASSFKIISAEKIVAIVPHLTPTSTIKIVSHADRAESAVPFSLVNDPRIPEEVSYKAGYVNPVSRPADFYSAMLWGIAVADTRVAGYQSAKVEIASTRLSCRIDDKDVILNDDVGHIRGGLYRRRPWFGTDRHDEMPMETIEPGHTTLLPVGSRPDKVWHFWGASPRSTLPEGKLEGCTVTARVKISQGALLQMGMDYWRSATVPYGPGGNNHEAGASKWYFPSPEWQEATFTDVGGVRF